MPARRTAASCFCAAPPETNGESITLHAIGATGLFTGAVATATGPACSRMGSSQMQHCDTITAVYQDASPAAQRLFTARADLQPPGISGVSTTNRFGKAQVKWTTDEPARSRMILRHHTPALGTSLHNSCSLTNHTAIADGQIPGQTNYFMLVCADEAGQSHHEQQRRVAVQIRRSLVPPVLVVSNT